MGFLSLVGRLSLDSSDWHAKIQGTKQSVNELKSNLAQFVTVSTVAFQAKKIIDYAAKIQDLSEQTGVGVERLQELDYALSQSGSSAEGAKRALIKLGEARRKALADPGSKEAKEFKLLGIDSAQLASLRDSGDLFVRLSDSIKDVKVDSNSIPVVLDLIGKKNAEVLPAMAAGLRASAEEARRLDLILGQDVIESLDDVGDQITTVVAAIRKPFAEVINFFLTALDSIQIGIKRIALAYVETVNAITQKNPFAPKSVKETTQLQAEAVREEFDKQFNAFLDRRDPEVIAKTREAKKARADRKRQFTIEELTVDNDPTQKKAARSAADNVLSDSLTKIGNFLGGTTQSPQVQQLIKVNELLRRIEQNTGKNNGLQVPL